MDDIEAMLYQVKVPDNQKGILRYSWWENNNLEGDLMDYEIYVHVFGGTSSLCCCIYVLRKTVADNASDFDVEVAETLVKPFCVDNLLKSVEFEDSAIQLIQDVSKICQRGYFNLTKFTSNRKRVLKSVPENHRKEGVKNRVLDGKLPEERTLRICWDAERV